MPLPWHCFNDINQPVCGVWVFLDLGCSVCLCSDLSNIYELLSPVEDSLDVFAMEFEEHVTNTGLAVMQSLQGENV